MASLLIPMCSMSENIFPLRNRAFRQDDSIYVTQLFWVVGNAEPELTILQSHLTPELGVSHREDLSSRFTTAIRRNSRQSLPQENRIDGQIKLGLQAPVGFPTSHLPEREAIVFIRTNRSDHTPAVNLPRACPGTTFGYKCAHIVNWLRDPHTRTHTSEGSEETLRKIGGRIWSEHRDPLWCGNCTKFSLSER
jgi:hypothetical protein